MPSIHCQQRQENQPRDRRVPAHRKVPQQAPSGLHHQQGPAGQTQLQALLLRPKPG